MNLSVNSIESFSTVDGPGIRTVVFLNSCNLRCKYCHNPEMQKMQPLNISVKELSEKILRNKNYFGSTGGVTFSGGEPLLQSDALLELCKILKKENINIALDTAGYTKNINEEFLDYIDLIILDIKHITDDGFKFITGGNKEISEHFMKILKEKNKKIIIRQVIIPGITATKQYVDEPKKYIDKMFIKENIIEIEFLPYHYLGKEKYEKLGIPYELDVKEMDPTECQNLYKYFLTL